MWKGLHAVVYSEMLFLVLLLPQSVFSQSQKWCMADQ